MVFVNALMVHFFQESTASLVRFRVSLVSTLQANVQNASLVSSQCWRAAIVFASKDSIKTLQL
jgi:hypothetical protein